MEKRIRNQTYLYSTIAKNNDTILLHGGGNFGDLYPNQNRLRERLMRLFPNNMFLIFPQTIYYKNLSLVNSDIRALSSISDLTIATRSIQSFEFAKRSFTKNKILLVPDMAFMLGDIKPMLKAKVDIMILRRNDLEKNFTNNQWNDILKKKLTKGQNVSFMV